MVARATTGRSIDWLLHSNPSQAACRPGNSMTRRAASRMLARLRTTM
jgi:hypothetical protein